jgi:hypothetical protein
VVTRFIVVVGYHAWDIGLLIMAVLAAWYHF